MVRAQVSTGIATGLEWLLMTGLLLAHVHYLNAVVAGAILGAAIDFSLKRWWVFSAGPGIFGTQAVRYTLVSTASVGLNAAAAYGLVGVAGAPPLPGVILASIFVGVGWNYPMHRFFVYVPVSSPTT